MKKTIKLQDLDCANCAAKIETAISKLEGGPGYSKKDSQENRARFDISGLKKKGSCGRPFSIN